MTKPTDHSLAAARELLNALDEFTLNHAAGDKSFEDFKAGEVDIVATALAQAERRGRARLEAEMRALLHYTKRWVATGTEVRRAEEFLESLAHRPGCICVYCEDRAEEARRND
ncbi:MAG TPA: hypothetical protein VHM25_04715 [Polyangiaceae bacterium]|jgi:hypothetical protein|nr:hypothetical protein [Polyangiaceae bacterium]